MHMIEEALGREIIRVETNDVDVMEEVSSALFARNELKADDQRSTIRLSRRHLSRSFWVMLCASSLFQAGYIRTLCMRMYYNSLLYLYTIFKYNM